MNRTMKAHALVVTLVLLPGCAMMLNPKWHANKKTYERRYRSYCSVFGKAQLLPADRSKRGGKRAGAEMLILNSLRGRRGAEHTARFATIPFDLLTGVEHEPSRWPELVGLYRQVCSNKRGALPPWLSKKVFAEYRRRVTYCPIWGNATLRDEDRVAAEAFGGRLTIRYGGSLGGSQGGRRISTDPSEWGPTVSVPIALMTGGLKTADSPALWKAYELACAGHFYRPNNIHARRFGKRPAWYVNASRLKRCRSEAKERGEQARRFEAGPAAAAIEQFQRQKTHAARTLERFAEVRKQLTDNANKYVKVRPLAFGLAGRVLRRQKHHVVLWDSYSEAAGADSDDDPWLQFATGQHETGHNVAIIDGAPAVLLKPRPDHFQGGVEVEAEAVYFVGLKGFALRGRRKQQVHTFTTVRPSNSAAAKVVVRMKKQLAELTQLKEKLRPLRTAAAAARDAEQQVRAQRAEIASLLSQCSKLQAWLDRAQSRQPR